MVRKGTSRAEALVNRAQPTSKTPTSGHSTKLERMNKRFGRREELLCSALSMINPQPTKDGKYPQVYIINPRKNRIKTIDLTCLSIKVSWFQINSQVCVCVCQFKIRPTLSCVIKTSSPFLLPTFGDPPVSQQESLQMRSVDWKWAHLGYHFRLPCATTFVTII